MTEDEKKCANCNHEREGHWDRWGGICVGCPCPGWKDPDFPEVAPPTHQP